MSRRRSALGLLMPSLLLLTLLVLGALQIREAVAHRVDVVIAGGLLVEQQTRRAGPDAVPEPCRPQDDRDLDALPEAVAQILGASVQTCRDASEVTLESWPEGRFVWSPGHSLTLERW